MPKRPTGAIYFPSPTRFREWLEANHADAAELWVGFHKRGTGEPSLTWPESVAEALCFGWIDGIRRSVDERRYVIRFTPRRARSHWSRVNVRMAEELIASGRMRPAGLEAFAARSEEATGRSSYEQRPEELPEPYGRRLRKARAAWSYFRSRPPHYRRAAIWWIISAKREETRLRRLERLIELSAEERLLPEFLPRKR